MTLYKDHIKTFLRSILKLILNIKESNTLLEQTYIVNYNIKTPINIMAITLAYITMMIDAINTTHLIYVILYKMYPRTIIYDQRLAMEKNKSNIYPKKSKDNNKSNVSEDE